MRINNLPLISLFVLVLVSFSLFLGGCAYADNETINKNKLAEITNDTTSSFLNEPFDLELLVEVIVVAYTNHVNRKNFDKNKITKGIVRGFMQSLDKHSNFLDPEEAANRLESSSGKIDGGIGIVFSAQKRSLLVDEVNKDSPAEKAGIKARDRIIAIDGVSVKNIQLIEITKKIRGEIGTNVVLKIVRRGEKKPIDITVTRGIITVQSVSCDVVKKENKIIGIIKITGFRENTYAQFLSETSKLMDKKPDYIIFDLRENPGGYVNSVRDIMSEIVGPGHVLFQEEFWDGRVTKISSNLLTTSSIFYKDSSINKFACLVNENTASAAEIMSSGLRDILGTKIIGEATYGKGTGWVPIDLKSGKGTCNVTCFRWLTPRGNSIEEVGVEPDIEVFMEEEDVFLKKDPQMDVAFEELLKK
ncbi:MAG: Carboxyl-terminal protease [Parcubacteria group bacterium GW2011_GWF2_38_76]|nr:MAG: Carboxyl-terminal protease [Parcubacteria group bacterium GW2011_GWF2_38_76]HBM45658.1 hypothetical protein [Patescibacteria group bacterium]